MKLLFDLSDNIGLDNFEVLSIDKNKNSPSLPVLRGKGTLHTAESFIFNDRIKIDLTIKKDKINGDCTELEMIYKIYSLFRTKGMVFIQSKDIYNKIFPSLEHRNIETLKEQILLLVRNNSNKPEILDDLATKLIANRLVDSYEEFKSYFPNNNSFNFNYYNNIMISNNGFKTAFETDSPFLVMLERMKITTIPSTTDGFNVEFVFQVMDDFFSDGLLVDYKNISESYKEFYNTIFARQKKFLELDDMNLHVFDVEKDTIKATDIDGNGVLKNYEKSITEEVINISDHDISQFEIITYNNIAEIPIQGRSSSMKQYLGVGDSNLTLKLYFNNDDERQGNSVLLNRLRSLQTLTLKEQRFVRIHGQFGYLNALDLSGLEMSDMHFSNDDASNGILVTIMFKASGYSYENESLNVNIYGERVNEEALHVSKFKNVDSSINNYAIYNFFKNLKQSESEQVSQFVISSNQSVNVTLLDLMSTYGPNSENSKIRDDIHSLKYIVNNFNSYLSYLDIFPTGSPYFSDPFAGEISKNHLYDKFVNACNSLFPSNAYESKKPELLEIVKIMYLEYLNNYDVILKHVSNNIIIDGKTIKEIYKSKSHNLSTNQPLQKRISSAIISYSLSYFKNILNSPLFLIKVQDVINLSLEDQDLFEDTRTSSNYTVNNLINEVKNLLNETLSDSDSNSDELSNLSLTIYEIRKYLDNIKYGIDSVTFYEDTPYANGDIISVSVLVPFCLNYELSPSFFGSNLSQVHETIVGVGTKANNLIHMIDKDATMDRYEGIDNIKANFMNPILRKIFGSKFPTKAVGHYRPLTSNIALSDLGSFLNVKSSDFGNAKFISNELIDSLDYTKKSEQSDTIYSFYSDIFNYYSDAITESVKGHAGAQELRDNISRSGLTEDGEDIGSILNTADVARSLAWDTFGDNSQAFIGEAWNNEDFRQSKIESYIKIQDNLLGFTDLFNSNIAMTIPTYDIYVMRESYGIDVNTYAETRKIEDFLSMDKMLNISVQYTENYRGKTAIMSFIDTTENVDDYAFTPASVLSRDSGGIKRTAPNVSNQFFSNTKPVLKIGDNISIRMGYNNNNKTVFNGTVSSIQSGKITSVTCISYTRELELDSIKVKLKTNDHFFNFNRKLSNVKQQLENASLLKNNINRHLILSDYTYNGITKNLSMPFLDGEEASTFNMVNYAIGSASKSMRHFQSNSTYSYSNLADGVAASQNAANSIGRNISNIFRTNNYNSMSPDLLENINNVDRDILFYGITTEDDNFGVSNSSFVFNVSNNSMIDFSPPEYIKKGVNAKTILKDAECRSPGSYFDVLDSGFRNTVFYGRGNYNIKLDDIDSQEEYNRDNASRFLKLLEQVEIDRFRDSPFIIWTKLRYALSFIDSTFFTPDKSVQTILDQTKTINNNQFDDSSKYEKASNIIHVVSGKNLITNNLTVNSEIPNMVTVKYDPDMNEKIMGAIKNFSFSRSVSVSSIKNLDQFEHRIREIEIDAADEVKSKIQAMEYAQSKLADLLSASYSGKIVIAFNPRVRYRTELKLHDFVNKMYGSVLVKDFEHKFDSRGAYTIITPMMKVEFNVVINDLYPKSIYRRLFYTPAGQFNDFSKAINRSKVLKPLFENNDMTILRDIFGKDIENVSLNVKHNNIYFDGETYTNDMGFVPEAITPPLKLDPIIYRSDFLIPDVDLYQAIPDESSMRTVFNEFVRNSATLFTTQKNKVNATDRNMMEIIKDGVYNRFSKLTDSQLSILDDLNSSSFIGVSGRRNSNNYESIRKVMMEYKIDYSNLYTEPSTTNFINENSLSFWNVKALASIDTERIENIAKVISNFDVMGIVEISGASVVIDDSGNKTYSNHSGNNNEQSSNAQRTVQALLDVLNLNYTHDDNTNESYFWSSTSIKLIRENGSVNINTSSNTIVSSNEYGVFIYRSNLDTSKNTVKVIDSNFTESITIDASYSVNNNFNYLQYRTLNELPNYIKPYVNNTLKNPITINISRVTVTFGNTNYNVFLFHNVFSSEKISNYYYEPISRAEGVARLFDKISTASGISNNTNNIVLGDFNMELYNASSINRPSSVGIIAELNPANPTMLFNSPSASINDYGLTDLTSYKTGGFYSKIPLTSKTTLGLKGLSSSYDNILVNRTSALKDKRAHVFKDMIVKDYDGSTNAFTKTRDTISDHLPVYIILGD